jgi:hypothetical protein
MGNVAKNSVNIIYKNVNTMYNSVQTRNTKANYNALEASKSNNYLTIFHQNICGLRCKTDELYSSMYPMLPYVVRITEHHLNCELLQTISFEGYKLGTNYCRGNSMKGDACIFVNSNLICTEVYSQKYCTNYDIEECALKIYLNKTALYSLTV